MVGRGAMTKSCGCFWKNTYDLSGEYGIGYTNKGEEFYFDLEDYDKIKDYTWYINNKGYVFSGKDEILMHRLVTNCPDNLIPDHIHGEKSTTDNRKSNLRIVNRSQNSMNVKIQSAPPHHRLDRTDLFRIPCSSAFYYKRTYRSIRRAIPAFRKSGTT